MNVPGLGERTLRTSIARSGFYKGAELQVCIYTLYIVDF